MGPFCIDRQYERIRNCERVLANPQLPPQTRKLWTQIRNAIALDEDTYNMRVMWTYRNHKQELVEWNP